MNYKSVVLQIILLGFCCLGSQAQAPEGYSLVWSDEFTASAPAMPDESQWWYETGGNGWGNNELQYYVAGKAREDTLALISDGTLKIKALKKRYYSMDYVSIRMNTKQNWKYGYFETRAKVPGKKGSWAAFWMMPQNFTAWPLDGEIDIMEYVGYRPNVTQTSIHTQSYNHVIHTEKTATKNISNAETEFHIYGLEWTEDKITGFVDGIPYFTFLNDKLGDKNTWPFDAPFYLKLNLAIGGNWGGLMGIDENLCPAVYEVDYVRVYQSVKTSRPSLEAKSASPFTISPTLADNRVVVSANHSSNYTVSVTNLHGQLIEKRKNCKEDTIIDCSGWARGLYVFTASNGTFTQSDKVLKK
jgi:beta-glucanase (GH16 family)